MKNLRVLFCLVTLLVACSKGNSDTSAAIPSAAVYQDRYNKLLWSKALPGKYSNGCLDENSSDDRSKCTFEKMADGSLQVKVEDSEAAMACKKIGSRLPTIKEYQSLITNFDYIQTTYGPELFGNIEHGPKLTEKGMADMEAKFGDHTNNSGFWSSSVNPGYSNGGLYFSVKSGHTYYESRNSFYAVRCVSP